MHPYKVIFLESTLLEKTIKWTRKGNIDGISTSNELEALIIEQNNSGYELVSITPLTGNITASAASITSTIGFMVTFKEIKKQ